MTLREVVKANNPAVTDPDAIDRLMASYRHIYESTGPDGCLLWRLERWLRK